MTPSASIIASATAAQTVVDPDGRRLVLRQLTALDKLRLFKAAGPLLAQNQPWLGMAILACTVASIDDVPVPPLVNEVQIEAMVSRLGDTGIATIARALQQNVEPSRSELLANAGKLSRHPDLIDCLYLIRNGVPFDVAFSLPPDERLAFVVVLGSLDGREFDWESLRWKERA